MPVTQSLPYVVGLDPSLTASALAWPDGWTMTHGVTGLTSVALPLSVRSVKLDQLADDLARFTGARAATLGFNEIDPALVAIEGLPTAGTKVDSERCYLWWDIVRSLTRRGIPVVSIPPATVKLYASGMGNANKREVIASAKRDLPQFEIRKTGKRGNILAGDDDNKADAAWLCVLACHLVGVPLVEVTPFRERALEKLILPEGVRPWRS